MTDNIEDRRARVGMGSSRDVLVTVLGRITRISEKESLAVLAVRLIAFRRAEILPAAVAARKCR